jgi:hypothetical protein
MPETAAADPTAADPASVRRLVGVGAPGAMELMAAFGSASISLEVRFGGPRCSRSGVEEDLLGRRVASSIRCVEFCGRPRRAAHPHAPE